jgi:hypothetical protein
VSDDIHSVPDVGGIAAIRNRRALQNAKAVREQIAAAQPFATGGVIRREDAPWADEHGIHLNQGERVIPCRLLEPEETEA